MSAGYDIGPSVSPLGCRQGSLETLLPRRESLRFHRSTLKQPLHGIQSGNHIRIAHTDSSPRETVGFEAWLALVLRWCSSSQVARSSPIWLLII